MKSEQKHTESQFGLMINNNMLIGVQNEEHIARIMECKLSISTWEILFN